MLTRILLSLPLWLAYSAVALALNVVGLVILLPLSLLHLGTLRKSKVYPDAFILAKGWSVPLIFAWRGGWLTWLWGNEEDGIAGPPWWQKRTRESPLWWRTYRWSALRNPSNNLRFVPGINPVIDPKRIKSIVRVWGTPEQHVTVTLTWQGWFSGLSITLSRGSALWRLWWGWKLKPTDRYGVPDKDMRKPRCGFAIQLKRVE